MNILRKSMAPISEEAWEEIDEQARVVLKTALSGRRFADVVGPKGWVFEAVSLGRLNIPSGQKGELKYGINKVLPLVETRVPFELDTWELDNAARGAEDIDLEPMENAAKKIAGFEEDAIYHGFSKADIDGLKKASGNKAVKFPDKIEELPKTISKLIGSFVKESVDGPYTLVLNAEKWEQLSSYSNGYPLKDVIKDLIGGKIILAPSIKESFLITERGGDFRLTIGQDFSIGYEAHDTKKVRLYFTESFTFQVLDPMAVVMFE